MNTQNTVRKVAIVGYNRIPFARANSAYAEVSNQQMMTAALDGLIKKYNLEGKLLGEVVGGAVIKHTADSNLMRECVMQTALDPATPACDLQQACDTGIESAIYIANKIALGQIDCGIAGGVDSISDMPISVSENLRKTLLNARKAKSLGEKIKCFLKLRLKDLTPLVPRNEESQTGLSMGGHTEITAKHYKISREDQDNLALKSHLNMAKAYDEGFFDDMITPFQGLDKDNNLRKDSSIEKLAKLNPAFDKKNGTLTAGNSTPLTDGASCVLLASEEWAKTHDLPILAYITFAEVAAIEYVKNQQNLLLAPLFAASRMLEKAGLNLQDFDYYEIHEDFAAQVLATLKIWESPELSAQIGLPKPLGAINRNKLNVKGSSLAAAHPFAATGGRIIGVMAKLLNQKGSGRGFISICAAGGQGITMIVEK
ncbi:acetyl-CoA C-acetyltransferase [Flavobacterium sp. Fl-77]|uniref:Acetyl-CoA C-acetyltransferase n=1 Tax=Flavobacterium flavipigmentatum TaxID=2893884 RepID=A0AAJ2SJB3_9FLAO|nr:MULTISPECIES: acetyl-CoA C-acetyltransferase [unclassified Flavobacterium]MDX6183918.1 acetyl-CoA C-acetyltransferase [Flavobacterium sp. Fl-33]MDX6187516.1 acetyl-CoA C-acetyltransferase [Flavobacterium sp. Fl-77]UFH37646.1 acetyl-CoA C-acetyltransferase [Flavobacterium sp. F-70]